jgi:bifunctional non-homologous end joining protein LigD
MTMALPKIDPLRPVRSRVVPTGREWLYELKLDGFRGMLSIEGDRGMFRSKSSNRMVRFEAMADALARLIPAQDAILDGEIIVMREGGPDFNALFFRNGEPAYAAFDLLWLNGRDLRPLPLWRRKKMLEKLIASTPVGYVDHVDDPALFTVVQQHDLEGIIAKRRGDPYAPETRWVKVKVAGYSQMEGRHALFDRRR